MITFYLQYVHHSLSFIKVRDQGLYLHSANITLFSYMYTPSSNKQNKTQNPNMLIGLLANTPGKTEWAYKECKTLYRMAHAQLKSKWRDILLSKTLPIISLRSSHGWWKYFGNAEKILNVLGDWKCALCRDKNQWHVEETDLFQWQTKKSWFTVSLKHWWDFTPASDYCKAQRSESW